MRPLDQTFPAERAKMQGTMKVKYILTPWSLVIAPYFTVTLS